MKKILNILAKTASILTSYPSRFLQFCRKGIWSLFMGVLVWDDKRRRKTYVIKEPRNCIEHLYDRDWLILSDPLYIAACKGDCGRIKHNMTNGFNHKTGSDNTALHFAALNGKINAALMLIDQFKVDVNSRNIFGETPLHWAAAGGHTTMVEFLIIKGGQIDPINKNGHTPLFVAIYNSRVDVVTTLIKKSHANTYLESKGCYAVHEAATDPNDHELWDTVTPFNHVLRTLITDCNNDPNSRDAK